MSGPRRSPHVAARRAKALRLRQAGVSYAQIAQQLGLRSEKHARTDVSRAMSQVVREAGEELIALERDRYDRLQVMAWRLAEQGNTSAMRELIRLFERRAKLLGLDKQAVDPDADSLAEVDSFFGNLNTAIKADMEAHPERYAD